MTYLFFRDENESKDSEEDGSNPSGFRKIEFKRSIESDKKCHGLSMELITKD